jgi:hypothetical protein
MTQNHGSHDFSYLLYFRNISVSTYECLLDNDIMIIQDVKMLASPL